MTKKYFLHIQYYQDGVFLHHYYTGKYDDLRDQLEDILEEELPETSFFFQSVPFDKIETSRYVKLL